MLVDFTPSLNMAAAGAPIPAESPSAQNQDGRHQLRRWNAQTKMAAPAGVSLGRGHVTRGCGPCPGGSVRDRAGSRAGGGSALAPPEQTCRRAGDTAVTTEPAGTNTAATAASRAGGAGDQAASLPPPPPRMPRRKVSGAGEVAGEGAVGSGRSLPAFPSLPVTSYR